ncbi:MAG: hypothetical protein E5V62_19085 [Mesorhizobium sp.]|uniref:hypothetical protein n=1 Tax=Mesorhizobium sp. TaxID=1871066 RepID=UPI000FD554E1|nr:hypothetical protein [Mesorhizobium sp.]RVD73351.1 hypothetical protein EN751_05425 [Mesorhizobium sp. M4A.F.Ca.ET.029.04.2.1]TIW33776.1 MAG: hypothetical protein E5V62_19085 [Mesorhizobium sp.]
MAKDRFTTEDLEEELRRRSRGPKAAFPKGQPKKEYPNSDRFGEDGRRLYSAYDAASPARPTRPPEGRHIRVRERRRLAAIVLASALLLIIIAISVLP